ncbi:MAG: glycosyltransferase [Acidimicrobiia bacterium]|nr:glycosyltransferase [Acidimicrobiia bacterium]NNF64306.1 glycosyltransferase [Acidimicrobiia bacterium]
MKVLFVINSMGAGGAERSLAQMVPGFAERGIESKIVCLSGRRTEVGTESADLPVRYMTASRWFGRLRELRSVIDSERPDVLHTTLFDSDIIGRIATIGRDVPVMTSLVNTSYDPSRMSDPNITPWKLHVVRHIDGFTARRFTDHFHALTEPVKDSNVSALGIDPNRVSVIPRGRDREWLGEPSADRRAEGRRRLGIAEDATLVINVGRQEFQKGQETLLHAAALLRDPMPNMRTVIAGKEGNVTRQLAATHAELDLSGVVEFLGYRSDVPDLVAAADIFAFPSVYEGLGGAVIEAMGLGIPVIASDIPVLAAVVSDGESGLLTPPGDPVALADAIGRLAKDPATASAMGARGYEIFEDRYRLDAVNSAMADLFLSMAQPGH